MKPCYSGIIAALLFIFCGHGQAQTALQASQNPVIMHYYSLQQLQELENTDTAALNSVIYYFTQSFIVEPIQCNDCLPFDSAHFDVAKYEYLRLPDQTFIRTFDKYGFKLILFPVSEMPYYYPIQHVPKTDPGDSGGATETETNQPH